MRGKRTSLRLGRFTYRTCVPYVHVYSDGKLIAYYRRGLDAGSLVCLGGCFLWHGVRPLSISAAATTLSAAEQKIRRLIRDMAREMALAGPGAG